MTFGKEEKAAAVAVIGTILPIVYAVALLIYRKRMPQYEKKSVVNPVWYIETPEKLEEMKKTEKEAEMAGKVAEETVTVTETAGES